MTLGVFAGSVKRHLHHERPVSHSKHSNRTDLLQPRRAHDRAVWTRALTPGGTGFTGGPWDEMRPAIADRIQCLPDLIAPLVSGTDLLLS